MSIAVSIIGYAVAAIVTMVVLIRVTMWLQKMGAPLRRNTRILVCAVGDGAGQSEQCDGDAAIYRKHYTNVRQRLGTAGELKEHLMAESYDIVHLIEDEHGQADGSWLDVCGRAGTRLLVLAANRSLNDVKGTGGAANSYPKLSVLLTLDRKGEKFSNFLDKWLARLAKGDLASFAYIGVCPQAPNAPEHEQLPSTLFLPAKLAARLVP